MKKYNLKSFKTLFLFIYFILFKNADNDRNNWHI